tara:strand:- start:1372 stop:1554 length:183 start_codon:yes stop_codon:yes gene_type:complete
MAKKDYDKFLYKIDQLNQLVEFINRSKNNLELITSCETHDEVIELAKRWGYEIGSRWGET